MIKDSAPSIEDQKINKLKEDIQLTQHFENRIINVYLQLTTEINKLEKRIKALENGDTD
jgi:hypothetical protein